MAAPIASSACADPNTCSKGSECCEFAMSELRRGARGRVARILGETADTLRLKALGLCEGREIEILRTGDAWIVRVLGSRIGLSRRLAESVLMVAA